jgi:putative endonuclease
MQAGGMDRKGTGREGERAAARWLEERGYRILARNFRSRIGEIDIIASRENILVFCEVKTWNAYSEADLSYAIGERKRFRIVETSKFFMDRHREFKGMKVRYDVILIQDGMRTIRYIESAFTE